MVRKQGVGVLVFAIVACLALSGTIAQAQKKTAKQTESLSKAADDAKKQMTGVLDQLGKMLQGYNAIIDGSAKNAQSAYKKLAGDLKSTEKQIQGAQKSAESLGKEAQKFFASWEKDLDGFTNEDMKQKSMDRLEASKAQYAKLGEALGEARDVFDPVVQNLNDQILFLGRDLSPEAIADLQDEAEALNQQAKEATEQVQALISSAEAEPVEEQ